MFSFSLPLWLSLEVKTTVAYCVILVGTGDYERHQGATAAAAAATAAVQRTCPLLPPEAVKQHFRAPEHRKALTILP
jgi:hypothetical protein